MSGGLQQIDPKAVAWVAGDEAITRTVAAWFAGEQPPAEVLRDHARRRVVELVHGEERLLVKLFRRARGRHALRDYAKVKLGLGGADREFRALRSCLAAGASVPEALALGRSDRGEGILVCRFIPGETLVEALATSPNRSELLAEVARVVGEFHATGFVHGDLHAENVFVSRKGPQLIDLQSARRSRSPRLRCRDLGDLDYSLWLRTEPREREEFRRAAVAGDRLGCGSEDEAAASIEAAAALKSQRHAESRTRRAARPGRRFVRFSWRGLRGLCRADQPADRLAGILEAHQEALASRSEAVEKDDGRSRITRIRSGDLHYFVKEVPARTGSRAFADRFRGSAGRRAWGAAFGLEARRIPAARAVAFLEERTAGFPTRSLLVMEALDGTLDALELADSDPAACLEALLPVIIDLHRRGVDHGDLKITNLLFVPGAEGGIDAYLVDLEAVRFRRRLADRPRIEALAQLNASLPDSVGDELRREAFRRYCEALPFDRPETSARDEIVRSSLRKAHRWSGSGCLERRRD